MAFAYTKLMQAMVAAGVVTPTDPYFNLVTLLLPGNGTNGAQNNTFLDSSSNNFTITRNGNTTQGTFSPFSQTGWSNYFNGSSQLSTVANPNLAFGTGAITFECWINTLSTNNMGMWGTTNESQWTANSYAFNYYNGDIILWNNSTLWSIAVGTLHDGNWHHVAIVRNGTTWQVFADGVSKGTTTTEGSRDLGNNAWRVAIGQVEPSGADTRFFIGYLSNMRVSNTAIYTSNFTPSTTPLTTTSQGVSSSNVKFLSLQSNRFVDNSTNATTFTTYGTPSVQAFSPFAPTAAYSASTVGGSGYFDGSGDYLTAGAVTDWVFLNNFNVDFTVSFWLFHPSASTSYGIISTGWNTTEVGFNIVVNNSGNNIITTFFTRGVSGSAASFDSSANLVPNAWNYVTITYTTSSKTVAFYINGAASGSGSNTGFAYSSSNPAFTLNVGRSIGGTAGSINNLNGYLSGLRILNGSIGSTTLPTEPPTNITNTSILLNFTNAGITDATAKNDLETVGNASISTTQSKFGGGSMYFDGTGDYLLLPSSENLGFGTGDFTIEGWLYLNATSAYSTIISNRADANDATTGRYSVAIRSSTFEFYSATGAVVASGTVSTSTWTHFAVTRASGSVRLFLGGTQQGSTTSFTTSLVTRTTSVGANNAGTEAINAYIDDLRITKGYARYTANFTPTTTTFPLQ